MLLDVQQLSVNYRGTEALAALDFQLEPGQLAGLVGPNGAGKSTMLKGMLGLVPSQGRVLLDGKPLLSQRRRIAYMPQRSQIDWDYPITVERVVMMGRSALNGWGMSSRRVDRDVKSRVAEALDRVELSHLSQRPIGQLSGGQQQRVFLARALAQDADLFLFDEPLAAVDKKTELLIFSVYDQLKAQGKSLLVSCHDWGTALERYDRLLLLNQCLIAKGTPMDVMTPHNLQQAYGVPMKARSMHDYDVPLAC
jgi:manganese/iron transport system ATP-binding protein